LLSSLFLGCGYKPSSYYQNKVLGNNINTKVEIDVKNPRETIFFKDALNDAVYTVLGKSICNENCDTIIKIKNFSTSITALDFDTNGYPILYRSKVNLNVEVKGKVHKVYSVNGNYDFSISNNSILTDQIKLEASKKATINALNKLFAKITEDGAKK
jgi:hypothetical protein